MIPERRIASHPGVVLREDFLAPLGMSTVALAEHIARPAMELENITAEKAPVTAELAWLLSMALDTTPQFWMNLQAVYDLTRTRPDRDVPALTG